MTILQEHLPNTQLEILDGLLQRLEGVTPSGGSWKAKCPAHDDRRPSLSIRETDDRILVHCWAGCLTIDVLHAVGLEYRDLFARSQDTGILNRTLPCPQPKSCHWKRVHHDLLNRAEDYHHRAEKIFEMAKTVEVTQLKDNEFDLACHCVAIAHDAREEAKRLEALADDIAHTARSEKE